MAEAGCLFRDLLYRLKVGCGRCTR